MKITILSENCSANTLSLSEWGWSAFIEYKDRVILFDTGMSGNVVVQNAKILNIDLSRIDTIILSHGHYDHCNGLKSIVKEIGACDIYCHQDLFIPKYSLKNEEKQFAGVNFTKEEVEELGGTFKLVNESIEIIEGVHLIANVPFSNKVEIIPSTFQLLEGKESCQDEFKDELNLAIVVGDSVLAMSGCAHRGIVNILKEISEVTRMPVSYFFGGTHLKDASLKRIDFTINYFRSLPLKMLAPAHCTGFDALNKIKNSFGECASPAFCGLQFVIND